MTGSAIHVRERSGLSRIVVARMLALALIFAVFIPTLSPTHIDLAAAAPAHQTMATVQVAHPTSGPLHRGCCCIESLQHCWYRTANADAVPLVVRPVGVRPAYIVADEAARSRSADPLRKPPRA